MATAQVSGLTAIQRFNTADSFSLVNIGGGPGAGTTQDVFTEGDQAVGRRVNTTGAVRGFGVDLGGSTIDFTIAGRYLWIWWNAALGPTGAQSRANGGIRVRVSSNGAGTSNYAEYYVGGGDVTTPRWNMTVLDLNGVTPSNVSGSPNFSAIDFIGLSYIYDTAPGGNIPHVVMDALFYGSTLQITGGDSGDPLTWEDILANQLVIDAGILQRRGSIYFANGTYQFGSTTAQSPSGVYFADQDQIVEWENQIFDDSTGTLVSSVPDDFQGITIAGNATGEIEFQDGLVVGSDQGSNGSVFQKPPSGLNGFHFTASDADIDGVRLYGTQIRRADNDVSFAGGLSPRVPIDIYSVVFDDCAQVFMGQASGRNIVFSNHDQGVNSAALLWDSETDVRDSVFRNNTALDNGSPISSPPFRSAGIEFDAPGEYDLFGLSFAGNDDDVLNSVIGSPSEVVLNISGGGDSPTTREVGDGPTTVNNNVQVTITDIEPGTEIRVYPAAAFNSPVDLTEIDGTESTGSPSEFSFSAAAGVIVDIVVLHVDYVLPPDNRIRSFVVPNNDTSFPVSQIIDRNFN